MEKTYYLVHLYFGDFRKSEKDKYTVYEYQKSRRFTAGQAWKHIHLEQEKKVFATGNLPPHSTIDDYWSILKKLNLSPKICDRYCTFGFIH